MAKHLQREIKNLKKKLLSEGAQVESMFLSATTALEEHDEQIAREVIEKDIEIDNMEVDIEEDCLKILALHQPVAIDLRFIVAVLKINNDLERIGDLAVNIAERAIFLASRPKPDVPFDFGQMAEKARKMLKKSLDALVNLKTDFAQQVCASDDEVDAINRRTYIAVQEALKEYPGQTESLIHLLSASRHLERIADHATNIAEDVIYMIEGQIIRHRVEEYK